MATVNYRIKGKGNPANIKIRFKQGEKFDCELATGLKTKREHWNSKQQKVKLVAEANYKDEVNNHLNLLRAFIEREYLKVSSSNLEINSKWLKNKLNEYFGRTSEKVNDSEKYLINFITQFIEESILKSKRKQTKTISESTIDAYRGTKNKLILFEKFTKRKIKLSEVNLDFHKGFLDFLETEELLSNNTIGFYISKIKAICRRALEKGYKVSYEFKSRDFYTPSNETIDTYLTKKEIDRIFDLNLPLKSKLDNIRDWAIIGV